MHPIIWPPEGWAPSASESSQDGGRESQRVIRAEQVDDQVSSTWDHPKSMSYRHEESADLRQSQGDAGVSFGRRGVGRDLHVQVVVEMLVTWLLRMATFLLLQREPLAVTFFLSGDNESRHLVPADNWTS
jgi:hypothetical protein